MKVSAVVVSRMDRPIGAVTDSIVPHVEELIVIKGKCGVWERWSSTKYNGAEETAVWYTQDDDAVVDVPAVLAQYEPGKIVCNMPESHRKDYRDGIALVGWGCVLDADLVNTAFLTYIYGPGWREMLKGFAEFPKINQMDDVFRRECDRVVTGLSPLKLIDVPIEHLPHAFGSDRMGRESRHGADLKEIRRRIYAIRAAK